MNKSGRRWLVGGAFLVAMLGASVAAWRMGGRGFEATASAASKHAPAAARQAVDTTLLSAPEATSSPAPAAAPARPPRVTPPRPHKDDAQGPAARPL